MKILAAAAMLVAMSAGSCEPSRCAVACHKIGHPVAYEYGAECQCDLTRVVVKPQGENRP